MIGIDIIEIDRIAAALSRAGFSERVFTKNEIAYIAACGHGGAGTAAGMFAAKEAAAKALGTGFSGGITLKQIEISHSGGAPVAVLYGDAKKRMRKLGDTMLISISHCKVYAAAIAEIKGRG
jgi:holo-[acyl-carrier protein] synthase